MAVVELPEIIAAPYTAFVAPVGEKFPKLTESEAAFASGASGWTKVGTSGTFNYSEAGITITHSQTIAHFISAGGVSPRKAWRTEEGMKVAFDLADLSPKQYGLILEKTYHGSPNKQAEYEGIKGLEKGTGTEEFFEIKRGITTQAFALLLRGKSTINETKNGQYELKSVVQAGNPALKLALKGGPAMLTVEWDVLELEPGSLGVFRAE